MTELFERAKVVLKAAVTYLTLALAVVSIVVAELAEALPDQTEALVSWGGRIIVWLTVAVTIIRRVTPVIPSDRGLLTEPPVVPEVNVEVD